MAIYTTFFLCEPNRLLTGFPGWKLPLPEPVVRRSINPFTREEMKITTREPEWDDFDSDDMETPEYQVVAIEDDYETYLEQRIPPFVRSQPHWCAKDLTSVELEPLIAAAARVDATRLEPALFAHPSIGSGIDQLPDDFVAYLCSADDASQRSLANEWAERMSTPEYTHSVSGERLSDDWIVDDALGILRRLAELAKRQTFGQSLFLLVEV